MFGKYLFSFQGICSGVQKWKYHVIKIYFVTTIVKIHALGRTFGAINTSLNNCMLHNDNNNPGENILGWYH
jgi:hypothetical protein